MTGDFKVWSLSPPHGLRGGEAQTGHLDWSPPLLSGHWPQGGRSYSLASAASSVNSPEAPHRSRGPGPGGAPGPSFLSSSAGNCE